MHTFLFMHSHSVFSPFSSFFSLCSFPFLLLSVLILFCCAFSFLTLCFSVLFFYLFFSLSSLFLLFLLPSSLLLSFLRCLCLNGVACLSAAFISRTCCCRRLIFYVYLLDCSMSHPGVLRGLGTGSHQHHRPGL